MYWCAGGALGGRRRADAAAAALLEAVASSAAAGSSEEAEGVGGEALPDMAEQEAAREAAIATQAADKVDADKARAALG
jgi:chromosome segregation protein